MPGFADPGLVSPLPAVPYTALLEAIAAVPALPLDACRVFHGRGGVPPGCEMVELTHDDCYVGLRCRSCEHRSWALR